jgi:hypothetical protein
MKATGKSVMVIDHNVFSFSDDFVESTVEVRKYLATQAVDVGIIVIGTGDVDTPFRIAIEPGMFAPLEVFNALIDWRETIGSVGQ